jgi:hypothetical protein
MKSLVLRLLSVLLLAFSGSAHATFHLWYITELFSNADGTIQFIELKALASGQEFVSGHTITSSSGTTTRSFTFPSNLPGDTASMDGGDPYYGGGMTTYKSMLIGTQGFAGLGIVKPDFVVPNGFLFTTDGRVNFGEGADSLTYGSLPTDGSHSLYRDGATNVNTPMNFAGESGTVSAAAPSYEGLWLRTPFDSESGWGLNITHEGNILVGTWFTYDTDGSGMWLIMSNGAQVSPGTYTGPLYRTTGPGFNAAPFTSLTESNYTTVGSLTLAFSDANTATMSYTVNGVTQSKPIARFIYSLPAPTCTLGGAPGAEPNYQDLWWNDPANSESGWGVNLTHQGDILVATWFTYEAGGTAAAPAKGMWLIMSNGVKTAPGVYSGDLQRTTGPAFSAVPFNPAQVVRTTVGNATFSFTNAINGTFRYTVNGITQTKPIIRLAYATPMTVCRQ